LASYIGTGVFLFGKKMKTIRCQNKVLGTKNGRCGRIVAVLTDAMIDLLRLDPEKGPLFRCPQCHTDQRWAQISVDKDGEITFEVVDPPEVMPEEPKYKDLIIFEQVG
jgi:hypothetical protein